MTPLPEIPPPLQANPHLWPVRDPAIQAAIDTEHLRLLEIALYVAGAFTALVSCLFIFHFSLFLVFGLNPQMFANGTHGPHGEPPPTGIFLGVAAVIGILMLLGWTFGALQIYAGRCLRKRRHFLFVMVVTSIECAFLPWGTFIGVCGILLLSRPSVKTLFA